jgi:hypothetical protein
MLSLVNLVVGVWVLLSPWLLGFSGLGRPAWNAAATGLGIAAIAAAAAMGVMRRWPGATCCSGPGCSCRRGCSTTRRSRRRPATP